MRLFLSSIGRNEWLAQLNKIERDKKWFLSINNHRKPEFFSIYFSPKDEERIQIGACAFTKFDVFVDCSIFIFPEYQRNGNAKQIISDLTSTIFNIQFTVSTYNSTSLSLFNSIPILKVSQNNERNRTITFMKNNKYVCN
jgi:hypothetical protein